MTNSRPSSPSDHRTPAGYQPQPFRLEIALQAPTLYGGTDIGHLLWPICRDAAARLPAKLRIELHTDGQERTTADPTGLVERFAVLLEIAVEELCANRSGWIEVRIEGDRLRVETMLTGRYLPAPREIQADLPLLDGIPRGRDAAGAPARN